MAPPHLDFGFVPLVKDKTCQSSPECILYNVLAGCIDIPQIVSCLKEPLCH